MDLGLRDKVAVITGGSIGIGLAIAEGLAQEGVHLELCDRDESRVVEKAKAIGSQYGVKTVGIKADVSKTEDLDRFLGEINTTFGGADILINNAGTGSGETVMDASDEKWQYYWDLHVMG